MKIIILSLLALTSFSVECQTFYETYPGSGERSWGKPALSLDKEGDDTVIYRTLPGSNTIDWREPGVVIKGNQIYQTYPGSNTRNWSKPAVGWDE